MIARTGWTIDTVARLTERELAFVHYWCATVERRRTRAFLQALISAFERILGVHWRAEDIFKKDKPGEMPEKRKELRIPLALAMNVPEGQLMKLLRRNLDAEFSPTLAGDIAALQDEGEMVGSMMELTKDDFFEMLKRIEEAKMTSDFGDE